MGRDAAPAAKPARRWRDQAETHFIAIEFAHLGAEIAQAVDQAKLERLPAGPELAGEKLLSRLVDARPTPALTRSMNSACTSRWMALIRSTSSAFSGRKGSSVVFVAPCGIDAPLDADLVDQLVQAEGRGDDADRADNRACIGIDLVAGDREQIASRRGDVLGEHIDLEPFSSASARMRL